jgi:hypothetical protein
MSFHPFLTANSRNNERNPVSSCHTTLLTELKQSNPATQNSQSLQAKATKCVQSGYECSLLITNIYSTFPNAFHTSCPFQYHHATSLAVQAVNCLCKNITRCSKRLSASHVMYSFTHFPATRLPSTVRSVVYACFGLDRQILINGKRRRYARGFPRYLPS